MRRSFLPHPDILFSSENDPKITPTLAKKRDDEYLPRYFELCARLYAAHNSLMLEPPILSTIKPGRQRGSPISQSASRS
jgi:hypothetical protein